MITPSEARKNILAALQGVHQAVSVYEGRVPDTLPTYRDGTIKPYVAVWCSNSVGDELMEATCSLADTDATRLTVQTTITGARISDVYEVADLVRAKLTNLKIGVGRVKPDYQQHAAAYPITDTTTAANHEYLPLFWYLNTQ